jgi:hypothetical protein
MQMMTRITLNLLSEKVKENLSQIQRNQIKIQELIVNRNSNPTQQELEKEFAINLLLLNENMEFLYTQLTLSQTDEKNSEALSENENYPALILKNVNDCFELTMDGFVIYNSIDQDENFLNRLSNYSQQLAQYEKAGCLRMQENSK